MNFLSQSITFVPPVPPRDYPHPLNTRYVGFNTQYIWSPQLVLGWYTYVVDGWWYLRYYTVLFTFCDVPEGRRLFCYLLCGREPVLVLYGVGRGGLYETCFFVICVSRMLFQCFSCSWFFPVSVIVKGAYLFHVCGCVTNFQCGYRSWLKRLQNSLKVSCVCYGNLFWIGKCVIYCVRKFLLLF